MRLFRQNGCGDWAEVFDRVAQALRRASRAVRKRWFAHPRSAQEPPFMADRIDKEA
jgi:hypothetical protein